MNQSFRIVASPGVPVVKYWANTKVILPMTIGNGAWSDLKVICFQWLKVFYESISSRLLFIPE